VDLPDGTDDDDYLAHLERALNTGFAKRTPDLLCYIAGADPYREDQLGGLALTINGSSNVTAWFWRRRNPAVSR